jgi:two-component system sensor histidine kinase NreB
MTEDKKMHEGLRETSDRLSHIIDDVRDLSVELRPASLDRFGLVAALRSRASVYEQTHGVEIEFTDLSNGLRLPTSVETQVYRIVQEALFNACKYSDSDQIEVELSLNGDNLLAVVQDFGKGFDVDNPPILGTGCGLSGMRERASLIGAILTIESDEKGTTVCLSVPLSPKKEEESEGDIV